MYNFSETLSGSELNPRIPQAKRDAFRKLLKQDGLGSAAVVSDFLKHLDAGEIQVIDLSIRPFRLSAAPYSAVQSPNFDVLPSLCHSSCDVFRKSEELPRALMANLLSSMVRADDKPTEPRAAGQGSTPVSREIILPLLG